MSRNGSCGFNLQVEVTEYFVREGFDRHGCVGRFENELSRKGISCMNVSLTVLDLRTPWYVFTDNSSYRPININFIARGSNYNDSDIAEAFASAVVNNVATFNVNSNRTFEVNATNMGKIQVIQTIKDAILRNSSLRNIRGSCIGYCGYSVTPDRTQAAANPPVTNDDNGDGVEDNVYEDAMQNDESSPGVLDSISRAIRGIGSSASRRIDASTDSARQAVSETGGVLSNLGNAINTATTTANSIVGDTTFVKTATYVLLGGFGLLIVVKGVAEVRKFIQPYSK